MLSGRYEQTDRNLRFEELLGFESRGSLFGKNLLLYSVLVRGGLSQERFDEVRPGPDLHEDPGGSLFEYDLNVTLFPRGKISGNAFAQRLDSRIPRAFQPSLDQTRERYGGGLYFNDRTLPMRLTFEHVWDDLTSRSGDLLDDEQRGRDVVRYEATWQISEQHSVTLNYEYDDRHEQYSGTDTRFDTTRNYVTLNHVLRFGLDGRSSWENLLRLQDEAGDLARDTSEFSSRLRLYHTDWLSTNYAIRYIRDSFQELETETWRAEAGLTHRWGTLLTSTVQFYTLDQQAERNADYTEWGSLANFAYRQENALGELSANFSYNHIDTDTRHNGRRGVIIAESVTFRDPLPSYLAHTDIDLFSIVVTDGQRTRTYLPGRDYLVMRIGDYVALHRIPTGNIPDRATVLVSYTYQTARDYDVTRDRYDFRIQQAFKFGLTPYYAFSIQDEDVTPARYLTWRARNVNRHRVGATYRQPRWSVGAEYEYNNDAIDPYTAFHANGDVVLWQTARQQLDGKANASRFWFDGSGYLDERDSLLCDTGLTYRHLLARDFEFNAAALYRYEDDSLFGLTHGVDITTALEWRIGFFSLRCEAEYDVLDLPGSRDNTLAVWLKLKRDIPLIGGQR